jgi:hypothetical protein
VSISWKNLLVCSAAMLMSPLLTSTPLHYTIIVFKSFIVAIAGEGDDSDWTEANVQSSNSGIQPMSAEPQSVDGVIDTLQGLVRLDHIT